MAMPLPVPSYTIDDLGSFPDEGQRYELLEGMLLVTPAPSSAHQAIVARLVTLLSNYLEAAGAAWVAAPGEVERAPRTLLDPDILVLPACQPPGTPWREISGWWLAVEVYSPSSRVYDREFKRPAYLRLGVREVWLVDPWEQEILSLRQGDARETVVRDQIRWQADGMSAPLVIPLPRLFEGLRISLPE